MAENEKSCPGDCMVCSPQQRDVCSAQMTRMMFSWMNIFNSRLQNIENRLGKTDEGLFNPMEKPTTKTQLGGGVENRPPSL